MKSYATYMEGEAVEGPINGLLTVSDAGIEFESFPEQHPMEKLFPGIKRKPVPKISWSFPRTSITSITDLKGRRAEPPGFFGKILRAMQVEPNGLALELEVEGAKKRLIFDCALPVYRIIAAYEGATA